MFVGLSFLFIIQKNIEKVSFRESKLYTLLYSINF